jgi:DNA-binding response OmpR family regulator
MTGLSRTLGLACLLAVVAPGVPALAASSPASEARQDVKETFQKGVELLQRGRDQEALVEFKRALAMNPTQEQAYELWRETDSEAWLEILTKGGEFELVARDLMRLVSRGMAEHRDDAEAIKALVKDARSPEPATARRAIQKLSAEHGEFAVPYLLPALADRGNEERRVQTIVILTRMGTDVVPPLIEALESPDEYLRRNVALTLGQIGDSRAAAMLAWLSQGDPDGGVRSAAQEALGRMGGRTDALRGFLQNGLAYLRGDRTVLGEGMFTDVVWNWTESGLVPSRVPSEIYDEEMAKKSFYGALRADPSSVEARAGLARAYVSEAASLELLAAAGQEVEETAQAVEAGWVAVNLTGAEALDSALMGAVQDGDLTAAVALAQALGDVATQPTDGLRAAVRSRDPALRARAAVALGRIALGSPAQASPEVIQALGEAAGRRVVRIAFVVDADAARAQRIASALESKGVSVSVWDGGAKALATLRRVPGVDLLVVSEALPDITLHQVIRDVRDQARTAAIPIVVLAKDEEQAKELYGDTVQGFVVADTVDGESSLAAIDAALEQEMGGDRARANALSQEACEVLADLAASGADVSPAVDALGAALSERPDEVAIPAARALGAAGRTAHAAPLVAVVADTARSDAARVAAGQALASIFGRDGQAGAEAEQALRSVVQSDASLDVRRAAATALGSMPLSADQRAELLRAVRTQPGAQG